ncbi:MAG: PDZ domain-containing protein [Deltaproteobacteria bacterium]|nr:PDZ domain-containing protein [Deltaproteobacteria bacterium]
MTKILMLGHEVEWRLQELLAGFTGERLTREAALERIAAIEPYALKTLELLSNGDSHIRTQEQTRSRSVEMVLRARMFVGGAGAAELFGVGVKLAAHPAHADGFPLVFQTVQQFGTAAAAGLLSGDELIAIDGKSLADWSPDRTVQGLATLVNEGRSWITGPLNTNVQLTVVRAGDGDPTLNYQKTVTLRRTVWAPRTTSAPIKTPVWSGNEAFAPWHGFVP